MSQIVTDADGTVHEFPDEATPEMMSQALGLSGANAQWQPVVRPEGTSPGAITRFMSGATGGHGPGAMAAFEGLGAAEAGYHGPLDDYATARERYAKGEQKFQAAHPVVGTAANIAGTIAPTAVGGGLLNLGARAVLPTGLGRFITGAAGYDAGGMAIRGGAVPLATRVGSQAAAGAVQGAIGGAVATPESGTDLGTNMLTGAGAGAVTGGTLGTATNAVANLLRGVPLGQATAQVADLMQSLGIDLRGGNLLKGAAASPEQAKQFTRALAGTFGEDAEGLTPGVMDAARTRIGTVMDGVAARTGVPMTGPLMNRLGAIETDIKNTPLGDSEQKALIRHIDDILHRAAASPNGVIPGEGYQALTKYKGPLWQAMRSPNSNISYHANEIRDALDNAMESAAAPADMAALRNARLQYKNLKAAEDLAEKAGPDGVVQPGALLQQVRSRYPQLAYQGTPNTEIGPLAKGGAEFLNGPRGAEHGLGLTMGTFLGGEAAAGVGFAGAEQFLHGLQNSGAIHDPAAWATAIGIGALPAAGLAAVRKYYNSAAAARGLIARSLNPQEAGLRTGPRAVAGGLGALLDYQNTGNGWQMTAPTGEEQTTP